MKGLCGLKRISKEHVDVSNCSEATLVTQFMLEFIDWSRLFNRIIQHRD